MIKKNLNLIEKYIEYIFAQKNLSKGIMPTEEIKGGIFLLISGLLLITPGFFTDCIGFAFFLKPVQNLVALQAKKYFKSRIRY